MTCVSEKQNRIWWSSLDGHGRRVVLHIFQLHLQLSLVLPLNRSMQWLHELLCGRLSFVIYNNDKLTSCRFLTFLASPPANSITVQSEPKSFRFWHFGEPLLHALHYTSFGRYFRLMFILGTHAVWVTLAVSSIFAVVLFAFEFYNLLAAWRSQCLPPRWPRLAKICMDRVSKESQNANACQLHSLKPITSSTFASMIMLIISFCQLMFFLARTKLLLSTMQSSANMLM